MTSRLALHPSRLAIPATVALFAGAYAAYTTLNFGTASSSSMIDKALYSAYSLLASPQFTSLVMVPASLTAGLVAARRFLSSEALVRHGSRFSATTSTMWRLTKQTTLTVSIAFVLAAVVGIALDAVLALPIDVASEGFLTNEVASPPLLLLAQYWVLIIFCATACASIVVIECASPTHGRRLSLLFAGTFWLWVLLTSFGVFSDQNPLDAGAALDATEMLSGGRRGWFTAATLGTLIAVGLYVLYRREARRIPASRRRASLTLVLAATGAASAAIAPGNALLQGFPAVLDLAVLGGGDFASAVGAFTFLGSAITGYLVLFGGGTHGWSSLQAIRYGSWRSQVVSVMSRILTYSFAYVGICTVLLAIAAAIVGGVSMVTPPEAWIRYLINWFLLGAITVALMCAFLWVTDHIFPSPRLRALTLAFGMCAFGAVSVSLGSFEFSPFLSFDVRTGDPLAGAIYLLTYAGAISVLCFTYVALKGRRVHHDRTRS